MRDEPGGPRRARHPCPSTDLGTKSGKLRVMGQMVNMLDFRPSHCPRTQPTGYTNEWMWPCPNLGLYLKPLACLQGGGTCLWH